MSRRQAPLPGEGIITLGEEKHYITINDINLGIVTRNALEYVKTIWHEFWDLKQAKDRGFLTIGYGPSISLLPEIIECCNSIVIMDSDPWVITQHRLLRYAITVSSSAKNALQYMAENIGITLDVLAEFYRREAESFGRDLHWFTNPERFCLIKSILEQRNPFFYEIGNFLDNNIRQPIINKYGIRFFNLTNIHYRNWRRIAEIPDPLDFIETIRSLPISSIIVYSHRDFNREGMGYPIARYGVLIDYLNELCKKILRRDIGFDACK